MTKKERAWVLGGFAAFILSLVAFYLYQQATSTYKPVSWEERDQTVSALESKLHDLGLNIRKMAGSGTCEFDSHCKVVGLGSPTCGEYKNYLIYSTIDTDEVELLKLVKEFNSKRVNLDKLSLSVPSCGVAPEKALCIKKRCQISR